MHWPRHLTPCLLEPQVVVHGCLVCSCDVLTTLESLFGVCLNSLFALLCVVDAHFSVWESGAEQQDMLRHRVQKLEQDPADEIAVRDRHHGFGVSSSLQHSDFSCPKSIQWVVESQAKDLYIESPIITVLAMDGKRRWLNITKMVDMCNLLGPGSTDHFKPRVLCLF